MGEINTASKKIADIISVVDGLAFQTNLLALNAAVEAARAGEQGRGFAVVASEVRNLAQRSAAAAKDIKDLINDSVQKVAGGAKLVDQSGETLATITQAVKKVSDIVAEIAAASREQSSGIEQVNSAVMQMDETTQQNAALVEEAAAASKSLEEQAHTLGKLMQFFKLRGRTDSAGKAHPQGVATHGPGSIMAPGNTPGPAKPQAKRTPKTVDRHPTNAVSVVGHLPAGASNGHNGHREHSAQEWEEF
jgi:methyl-accepting chemotaxis protein